MRGDDVVRIRGDRDDVFSAGYICPKGSTLKQLHEDPDRVRTPLIKRDQTSALTARMLAELPIADLTIEEPAIEEVIGRVFAGEADSVST